MDETERSEKDGSFEKLSPEQKEKVLAKLVPYIERTGWLTSALTKRPVDGRGQPIPWYTYSAIHFLLTRDTRDCAVFEFGCGHSTFWWSRRAASVEFCEHNPKWVGVMNESTPANVSGRYIELDTDGTYARAAQSTGKKFDIIVIDGRDRVNCAKRSLDALTGRGVFIWDNANRERYQEGMVFLRQLGFKQIDFKGHCPINSAEGQTSIFYRTRNCLDI